MTVTDLQTLSSGDPDADPSDIGSDKAIAGKSPTRIALQRLRSDKVAVISASIIFFFVLLALFAPLIAKAWGVQPEGASASEFVLNGLPKIGPPLYGFIWSHPFGVDPNTGNDLFARWLYGARLLRSGGTRGAGPCPLGLRRLSRQPLGPERLEDGEAQPDHDQHERRRGQNGRRLQAAEAVC